MPDTSTELYRRIASMERRLSAQEREAKAYGWQLNSFFNAHRFGGGLLMWQFDGHTRVVGGSSFNTRWSRNNMDATNYRATTYGGPNISLNGANEYLSDGAASEYEVADDTFLVCGWCYPTDISADRYIAAKWTTAVDEREWRLFYNNAAGFFSFSVTSLGTAVSNVGVTSTRAVAVDGWYFVAAYFEPSTLLRVYAGLNTDTELTIDSNVAGIPASVYNAGTRDLTIGAHSDPGGYFAGNIGVVEGRANVPSANIDEHANMLFGMTREVYEE